MVRSPHGREAERPAVHAFPLFLVVALACSGLALTAAVTMGSTNGLDRSLVPVVQQVTGFEPIALFFNGWLHREGLPLIWGCSFVAFLVFRKWPAAGLFALAALVGPANHAMKLLVDRPRPTGSFRILEQPSDPSFPSGHTAAAVGFFGTWFLVASEVLPRRYVLPVRVVCVAGILLAAVSRVWSGAHWPTDVTASILLWSALVLGLWLVVNAMAPPAAQLVQRAKAALPAWAARPLSAAEQVKQGARTAGSRRVRRDDPGY